VYACLLDCTNHAYTDRELMGAISRGAEHARRGRASSRGAGSRAGSTVEQAAV